MKKLTSYHEICTIMKVRMENIVNVIFPFLPRPTLEPTKNNSKPTNSQCHSSHHYPNLSDDVNFIVSI